MSSADRARAASYRSVTRFQEGVPIRFPGLTLTCEGEHLAPLAGASVPSVRILRFLARSGGEQAVVDWSPGLGAIAPQELTIGGRTYSLELAYSFALERALVPDELVLSEKPSRPVGAYRQWEGPAGGEFVIFLRMRDAGTGAAERIAAEVRVHHDGRVEAAMVHREALRPVTEALEEIGKRPSLYVNEPSPTGRDDRSRPVGRGEALWSLAVAQALQGLVPYRVDWEASGPVAAAP